MQEGVPSMFGCSIEIIGISKAFGSTRAVNDVSFAIASGSVHAITGENGAGKSTLMKILAGVVRPDAGEFRIAGKAVHFSSPLDALKAGISTVFQEFTLIPNLTVAESIFLGREPTTKSGAVDYRALRLKANAALARLESTISPDTLVRNLTVAEQQIVEIAKGISADASVFILDEPTAALNTADVEKLRRLIMVLKASGKTILYISHRLEEIFAMCDMVTVLKDGTHVTTVPITDLNEHKLVALMVGRELSTFFPPRANRSCGSAIVVQDLRIRTDSLPISFVLHRGEILGLAGLEGQGQRDIARLLAGVQPAYSGDISKINSEGAAVSLPIAPSVGTALARGVGFVPEDRKGEGLFLDLSIGENIAVGVQTGRSFWTIAAEVGDRVASLMGAMNVKATTSRTIVGALSGGNQQKVLIGRWLISGVDVLVIEEPTRGVDVGAKAEVYKLLRNFTDQGGALIVLSRDALELIGLCDRLLVVHAEEIVADLNADGATEHDILHSAIGVRQTA
jgi:ribose transport system ATP-binding protein